MKLKAKVFLSKSAYIDFEDGVYYYYDSETNKLEHEELSTKGIRILRCLCEHYEEWVSLDVIFEYVKRRELQANNYTYQKDVDFTERRNLGKYISDFSHKIVEREYGDSFLMIDSSRKSIYKLELLESSFEDSSQCEESCSEITQLFSSMDFLNEYLKFSKENCITAVDLTFFAGTLWRVTDDRVDILKSLNEHHIPCRIIISLSSLRP